MFVRLFTGNAVEDGARFAEPQRRRNTIEAVLAQMSARPSNRKTVSASVQLTPGVEISEHIFVSHHKVGISDYFVFQLCPTDVA